MRHAPTGTEVLVVDDASPGGKVSKCAAAFAGVQLLRLRRQRGFCGAANAGIQHARHAIVELLNDDTEVTAGWTEAALAAFVDPAVAAVAPLVLYWPGGEVGTARIDSAGDQYYRSGIARKRGHGQTLTPAFLRREKVFGASGSSAFFRRQAVLEAGGFAEDFDAYFEDVDLSFRLHWTGYDIVYEPSSRVLHHVGSSYGNADRYLLKQQARNEERVFWRNLPSRDLMRAIPCHLAVVAAKAWRRWRMGELAPFLEGRLEVLNEAAGLLAHRRSLRNSRGHLRIGNWQLEKNSWKF
jgi:GT2 family glycosyltransferase